MSSPAPPLSVSSPAVPMMRSPPGVATVRVPRSQRFPPGATAWALVTGIATRAAVTIKTARVARFMVLLEGVEPWRWSTGPERARRLYAGGGPARVRGGWVQREGVRGLRARAEGEEGGSEVTCWLPFSLRRLGDRHHVDLYFPVNGREDGGH